MIKRRNLLAGGWLILFILGLTGCGVRLEEPSVILGKMMRAMSQTEQAAFSGDFKIVGESTIPLLQGINDLTITGQGKINLADIKNFRYLLDIIISGMGPEGRTEIGAELRSFPDCNYFRVTKITLPLGLPFSLAADNKWYQIKSAGNSSDSVIGAIPALTDEQVQQIRQLIAQSKLFNMVQKFPDDTVNGMRTYHWQVAMEAEALRGLLRDWLNVTGNDAVIDSERLIVMLSDYTYEIWINKRDYRIIRANVAGWYDSPERQRVEFTIKLDFKNFNTKQEIVRPSSVEEFNLRELLGLPLANSSQ